MASIRSITLSTMYQKSPASLAELAYRNLSSVACEFSSIKIDNSDYPKSLISRINEVYEFLNKNFAINPINFIYNHLICCNHTCYCVNMVSVMSASRYITSASRYHPRYQSDPRCTSVF